MQDRMSESRRFVEREKTQQGHCEGYRPGAGVGNGIGEPGWVESVTRGMPRDSACAAVLFDVGMATMSVSSLLASFCPRRSTVMCGQSAVVWVKRGRAGRKVRSYQYT